MLRLRFISKISGGKQNVFQRGILYYIRIFFPNVLPNVSPMIYEMGKQKQKKI